MTDTLAFETSWVTLRNGARGLLLPRPDSPTLALSLLVRAGSRHDGSQPGLAHLVEHLVFRAPAPPRLDLYAAVEGLGGQVDGGTSRDCTSFEIVVGAPHAARALGLLSHLARPPATDPASVRGEQLVICQELLERASAARLLWDTVLAALWGDHPLVHDPGGTAADLLAAAPEDAASFHARWHTAPRLLVVAAGACSREEFDTAVAAALGDLPAPPPPSDAAPDQPPPRAAAGRARYVETDASVVHLAVALAVAGQQEPDCAALHLLHVALGQGPDSRLQRAFTAHGLHAPVQSRYTPYWGGGVFAALAACPPDAASTAAALLSGEVEALAAAPPAAKELEAARARYLGTVYRACETNGGLAAAAGIEALFGNGDEPLARSIEQVATVSAEEVAAVATRYFGPGRSVRVSVGPRGWG